jgi:hypothetical protein
MVFVFVVSIKEAWWHYTPASCDSSLNEVAGLLFYFLQGLGIFTSITTLTTTLGASARPLTTGQSFRFKDGRSMDLNIQQTCNFTSLLAYNLAYGVFMSRQLHHLGVPFRRNLRATANLWNFVQGKCWGHVATTTWHFATRGFAHFVLPVLSAFLHYCLHLIWKHVHLTGGGGGGVWGESFAATPMW